MCSSDCVFERDAAREGQNPQLLLLRLHVLGFLHLGTSEQQQKMGAVRTPEEAELDGALR